MGKSVSNIRIFPRIAVLARLLRHACFLPFIALLRAIEEVSENTAQVTSAQTTDKPTDDVEWTAAGLSCPVAPDQGDGLGVRKSNAVGGQAVIEGVMMRGSNHVATAVRAADGRIVCRLQDFPPISQKNPLFKKPIARGAGMLFETLKLGIGTLDWSAKIATYGETMDDKPPSLGEKILAKLSLPIGLMAGMALFLWLPYSVAKWTIGADGNQFLYHLVSNGMQMTLLVTYMWAISLSKEIRRVFEYHGAEHKGIATYESGDPVEPTVMKSHTRFHPRCGTSFLLVLGLVTMLFFTIMDATLLLFGFVYPSAIVRVLMHLPFIPVVAGIGYEVLKWSDRKKNIRAVTMLIQPGLWLQRITTKEPDLEQLEVSAVSLRAAIQGKLQLTDQVVSESIFLETPAKA